MKQQYSELIKDASFQELFYAHQRLLLRRNLAVAVAVIVTALVFWRRWNSLTLVIPALIWFAAAGQHFHLKMIANELRRRKAESEAQIPPRAQ